MHIKTNRLHLPRFLLTTALALLFAGFAAGSAMATSTSSCTNPVLSQPFLSSGDSNWYTLVPGQTGNIFNGSGWKLYGGAKVVDTTQADGHTAGVLNLPSGSQAVSPIVCVTTDYPTARMMVRNVVGAEGVSFYVSYANTATWSHPKNTGQVHGTGTTWTLSDPVNLQPPNVSGWQLVQFTFVPGGTSSDFQIYDFYIDPFHRH